MFPSLYSADEPEHPNLRSLLGKTLAWAVLFGVTILIGMAGIVPQLLGAATQPMRSGALEPLISQGDLIVSEPVNPQTLVTGDIITFRPPGGAPTITRKVVAVEPTEAVLTEDGVAEASDAAGVATIVTSGDPTTKEYRISPGQVTGKVAYHLPFVGVFSNEALGAHPLVIVLAVVLVLIGILYLRYRRAPNER